MKTLGLIGGMSWESTADYYRVINEEVKARLGGLHSAKICLWSVDFAEIEVLQHQGRWAETAEILAKAAQSLEAAGAESVLICTNTMHKVAPEVSAAVKIPLLHIADATGQVLKAEGITRVGLLGTRFTMSERFYRERLEQQFNIDVLVPDEDDQALVHRIIYDELCLGKVNEESRHAYIKVMERLTAQGAQAVILGCTEIAMLVKPEHTDIRLFDTTRIHAEAAVTFALA